jgi:hypothetical protein
MIDFNILVNGSRCKQYHHNGKIYIEAKHGTEYELEIKNNTWNRILVIGSVDGLSVLSGETASDRDTGYVIGARSSYKIKGFRYSNDSVGAFRFNYKDRSYAKSKGDGSEINCGIISIKAFAELVKAPTYINYPVYPILKYRTPRTVWDDVWEYPDPWYDVTYTIRNNTSVFTGSWIATSTNTTTATLGGLYSKDIKCCNSFKGGMSAGPSTGEVRSMYCSVQNGGLDSNALTDNGEVFNMGTEWGSKIESKVTNTTFEKGVLISHFEIYYTDRNGLTTLGVPLHSVAAVSFPEAFPGNYAKPPKNWQG